MTGCCPAPGTDSDVSQRLTATPKPQLSVTASAGCALQPYGDAAHLALIVRPPTLSAACIFGVSIMSLLSHA